jgi:hypothetical protein
VAAGGVALGVFFFSAPAFFMGRSGVAFGYVLAWAMLWAPASLSVFDPHYGRPPARSLLKLTLHTGPLTLLFGLIFVIGRLAGPA